ncbi:MAG: phospholipase D-like domain-containing protein [bacterium]|nr:phospholipase D-like domain-containing protein [bacterium]
MPTQTPSFKNYLKRRQAIIDTETKQQEEPKALALFNEKTFYRSFLKDMIEAEKEVIIYSPFISKFRSDFFRDTFKKLRRRNIDVFIFTRPLDEHEYFMRSEIKSALSDYEEMGACIFYLPGSIHEKVAIIDREILWEGSLNILSQRTSRELMRRTSDEESAKQVMAHLGLNKNLVEGYKDKYERMYRSLVANAKDDRMKKARLFVTGVLLPILTWWLFFNFKVMIVALKGVKLIISFIRSYH